MSPTTSNGQQLLEQQVDQLVAHRKRKYQNSATSDNEFSDDESSPKTSSPSVDDDKRAHHNELERRRRDHIKDHFMNLKSSIPLLQGEKSSRALILKRAVDYITILQNQLKECKSEVEDLKRRNENLSQQTNGLNLKPFLTSLQLQPTNVAPAHFNPPISTQPSTLIQVPSLPIMPPTTSVLNSSPITSNLNANVASLISGTASGSIANGHPNNSLTALGQQPKSPQCTNAITTPVPNLQNSNVLANLSTLLLQNPLLVRQLQPLPNVPAFEPLTPPSSATLSSSGLSPDLVDTQARLLASSLALRERQFAAVVATNL